MLPILQRKLEYTKLLPNYTIFTIISAYISTVIRCTNIRSNVKQCSGNTVYYKANTKQWILQKIHFCNLNGMLKRKQ